MPSSLAKFPAIGLLMGSMDFSNLFVALDGQSYESLAAAQQVGAPIVKYGLFVNNVLDFLIVAFAVFMVIRGMNKLRRKQEEAPAEVPTPAEVQLLTEIRDALKARWRPDEPRAAGSGKAGRRSAR